MTFDEFWLEESDKFIDEYAAAEEAWNNRQRLIDAHNEVCKHQCSGLRENGACNLGGPIVRSIEWRCPICPMRHQIVEQA